MSKPKDIVKEFRGKLYAKRDKYYLGEVILRIEDIEAKPIQGSVYFLSRRSRSLKVRNGEIDLSKLILRCQTEDIHIRLGSFTCTNHIENSGIDGIDSDFAEICFDESKRYSFSSVARKNMETKILFVLPNIAFLRDYRLSFLYEVHRDLTKLNYFTKQYEYNFIDNLSGCRYYPTIISVNKSQKDIFSITTQNVLEFTTTPLKDQFKMIMRFEKDVDCVMRCMGFLDGNEYHYDRILIRAINNLHFIINASILHV